MTLKWRITEGQTFIYDVENKQVKVEAVKTESTPLATFGQYFYDGDGRRVKKFIFSTQETTVFVYDAKGQLAAEYSTLGNPTTQPSYLTTDHLGSPRIITDQNGNVTSRRDFHPYGEEVFTAQRTAALGYAPDSIRQKFTTYERDTETDLDFAQARYYGPIHGRFTSPDDFRNDSEPENPQSWNLYVYVRNNPIIFVDPTGKLTDFVDRDTGVITTINDGIDQVLAVDATQVQRAQQLFNDDREQYNAAVGALASSDAFNLHLTRAEFDRLANAVYAESSGGVQESQGIVNALENRAANEDTPLIDQVTDKAPRGVYGVRVNRYETERGSAADQKRLNVHIAIARGIPGTDITNGAYFWDGRDFNGRLKVNGGYRARYLPGYLFTSPSHDLYKQGNRLVNGTYKYQSTAAIGATTFSRLFKQGAKWYSQRR